MPVNNFLPFCPTDTGGNLLTQSAYNLSTDRTSGNKPGIASAALNNRALRQANFITSNLAQLASNITGDDTLDDNNSTNMLATLGKAFGMESYQSAPTTTSGAFANFSATWTAFDVTPTLTFTPKWTGKFKVYTNCYTYAQYSPTCSAAIRIFNSVGAGTLLSDSIGLISADGTFNIATHYAQAIYTLTAGVSYSFIIQGSIPTGLTGLEILIDGTIAPIFIFAERLGL